MKKNYCAIPFLNRIQGSKFVKVTRMVLFFIMICISQGFAKNSYAQDTRLSPVSYTHLDVYKRQTKIYGRVPLCAG